MRYLDCPEGSFPWKIRQLLEDNSTAIDPAVVQTWHDLIGDSPPCLSREIHRAAFAILWMGLRGEREGLPSMLAPLSLKQQVSLAAKSGVLCCPAAHGFHRSPIKQWLVCGTLSWSHSMEQVGILVSSSRMRDRSEVASSLFWDVPRADTHAVEDIGAVVEWLTERCAFHADAKSSLAVLRNRNDMTNLFRASNWVSESQDSIVSRGVTTCAGMTAHTVILAQTRVGFLTGGRKSLFSLYQKMNKWFNWRKRMLVLRWLSPGLGHFALSWAHENGLHALYFCFPKEIGQGKDIRRLLSLLMTNGRFLCSRAHNLVLNRDPSLLCLPSQGRPLSWYSWRWHVPSATGCQWQVSAGDTSWLWRRQKGDAN